MFICLKTYYLQKKDFLNPVLDSYCAKKKPCYYILKHNNTSQRKNLIHIWDHEVFEERNSLGYSDRYIIAFGIALVTVLQPYGKS